MTTNAASDRSLPLLVRTRAREAPTAEVAVTGHEPPVAYTRAVGRP